MPGSEKPENLTPPSSTAKGGHIGPGGTWVAPADQDPNLRAWCDRTNTPEKQAVIGLATWYNTCVSDDVGDHRGDECTRDPRKACHGQVISPNDLFVKAKEQCRGDRESHACMAREKQKYLLANDPRIAKNCSKYTDLELSRCVDYYYLQDEDVKAYSKYRYEFWQVHLHETESKHQPDPDSIDETKVAAAEKFLETAQRAITETRAAKGPSLIGFLQEAEAAFKSAGSLFSQAGDDDRSKAALYEAARMHLTRFIEGDDGKTSPRDCEAIFREFKNIDPENSHNVNKLVSTITRVCEPIIGK